MPLVLDPVRPALVVAPGDPADPVGRVPSNASNRFGRQPTRQEPEEVPAAALDRILRAPVASREFVSAQMRFEDAVRGGWIVSCVAFHNTTARLGSTFRVVDGSAAFGSVRGSQGTRLNTSRRKGAQRPYAPSRKAASPL